ncbi:SDR family oxidoreductase [Mesorhizobium sp. M7A.F.Ca.CA.004.11.2.1]|nr:MULTISPECIES: SDR family oxidoreductase [Mesorhizobium]MCF6121703.1 SDR family oxidoreductase [Mesorhizobium ciceri]MCQ8812282.1 SDR family oxidoreductase [Mesorhizobium sp. SEMIA396]RVA21700.1 SDR family oxidoreductase [Mesorhizobium sp. M7A.F.Ca.CA.004.11.2.1]RVC26987.1 SDR family oxidoreductase [Mesorhizobium sp. M7A.F.Ca.CA.004.04.2.1]
MALSLPEALDLSGQRIVVTGAASGIGRATASALASLGADLLLADVSSLDATCADLTAHNVVPETFQGDLLAPGAIAPLFASGPVRAVVHCAGIVPAQIPWDQDPNWEARFARTMAVNVRLPIELGHASIAHMVGNGGGRLILVGSLAGWHGGTLTTTPPDYVTSKGGLHALVRLLARKAASGGVLVNGVAPGPVVTPFSANIDFPRENFPLGRMATAEEIAWPIAFLCTKGASNFCGEIVNVNGGVFFA